jgi:hypothetical protein
MWVFNKNLPLCQMKIILKRTAQTQHPPVHHPLDASYDSVVDDPQLSYYPVSSW